MNASVAPDLSPPDACKCGHDKRHVMVSAAAEYTFWGWVLILIGITAKPIAIKYVCRKCEGEFGRTTDPKVIAETKLWG